MTSAVNRPRHGSPVRRPLRVAPAWVGAARPTGPPVAERETLPVREAVWVWSVRRFARVALWTLPLAAVAYGWTTLGDPDRPGVLAMRLAAAWLSLVAMIAIAALLAGSRGRRPAIVGLLLGLAGTVLLLPLAALPLETPPAGVSLAVPHIATAGFVAALVTGLG